jgi:hypothetical protein
MKRKFVLVLAGIVWTCQARPGFCQTPEERAGARAAADQGYDAFERAEWERALDLFERAESLVHSAVHLLYVARSNARLNRLIEAQEAYLRVVHEPLPAAAPAAVKQAEQDAARELAALEPQIPFISIEVPGLSGAESLEVTQDGHVLPPALVGVAHPLNPGEHTWQVRSGSRRSAVETRRVEPGSKLTLQLSLPEPELELIAPPPRRAPAPLPVPSAPVPSAPVPSAPVPSAPVPSTPAAPTSAAHAGVSPWVYAGFGVAATGLGVGTGFLLHKGNIEDRIRHTCSDAGCFATPENIRRKSDADRAGIISAVGFTAGGVGLAGALALWLLAPDTAANSSTGSAEPRVQLWLGSNGAGVAGSF